MLFRKQKQVFIKEELGDYKWRSIIAHQSTSLSSSLMGRLKRLKRTSDAEFLRTSDYLKMVADYKEKGLPMDQLLTRE